MSKTITEKLAAAQALVAKYEAIIASDNIVNNVAKGDKVQFKFGRAEKARVIDGEVVSIKDGEGVKTVAIIDGEFKVYTVPASAITSNPDADARDGSPIGRFMEVGEASGGVVEVEPGVADEDPLLNA